MSTKRGPEMSDPAHEDVLKFVRQNSKPFVTTNDVASEFDSVSRRTIQDRLNDLVGRDQLEKRLIGGNTAVWYLLD